MEHGFKEQFLEKWKRYFPGTALPIGFYYAENDPQAELVQPHKGGHCLINELQRVIAGEALSFEGSSVGCWGGKHFLGFAPRLRSNFNYFLSCGIPGELEGERYKASPELVEAQYGKIPAMVAPTKQIVFKRWDCLQESDEPAVVIFFAPPDVLSGLFTLANFDESDAFGVTAPMGSGCSSIVQAPYRELQSDHPHAVLGMFDVSARPWVPAGELTLAIPWPKFVRMVAEMDESFLITASWEKVKSRFAAEESR